MKEKGIINVVQSNRDVDLLKATYFCKVEGRTKANVVLEPKAADKVVETLIPQRYILVIDVSGSMDSVLVYGDPRTLLDRMKVFAELFIRNVAEGAWLSIVIFSNDGEILLPMTLMDCLGRLKARKIVNGLCTIGGTNISYGLFKGLDATKGAGYQTQDVIILFTDGEANVGIIDPKQLVNEYTERMEKLNRPNKVQLAAITIGSYSPYLLSEISKRLSGDAFYWLNIDCDFEADMLIPMFLREITTVTDIAIEIACLNGVTLIEEDLSRQGLQEIEGNLKLRYFIYSLPRSMTKNIPLALNITDQFNAKTILEVNISYLDYKLKKHCSTDYLELSLTSMKEIRSQSDDMPAELKREALDYMETTAAYIFTKSGIGFSWECAEESLVKVLNQQCRMNVISALTLSSQLVDQGQFEEAKQKFNEVIDEINKIKETTASILGSTNPHCIFLHEKLDEFVHRLGYGSKVVRDLNCARVTAMASSISTEMPTATGVFDPTTKQPFLPPRVEKKLDKFIKIVKDTPKKAKAKDVAATPKDLNWARVTAMASSVSTEMPTATGVFDPTTKQPFLPSRVEKKLDKFTKIVKDTPKKAKAKVVAATPKVFKAKNFVLSESLMNKKIGSARKETLGELIIKCGGTAVPHVGTFYNNTILVCSAKDYNRKSGKVRDAINAKIPIVKESFILGCIEAKKIVDIRDYIMHQLPDSIALLL